MKKKYLILIYLLIILFGIGLYKLSQPSKLVVAYYEKYIVQPHDTLWSISEQYPHGSDIRKFIYIIKDNNKIGCNIQVGQEILVPIIEQR